MTRDEMICFECIYFIYNMEKADFTGDNPSARFGHTITPIGKDKAILFGGALGDTGKDDCIQESTSSPEIHFYATILSENGKSLIIMECPQRTERPTAPSQSITSFTSSEELLAEEN